MSDNIFKIIQNLTAMQFQITPSQVLIAKCTFQNNFHWKKCQDLTYYNFVVRDFIVICAAVKDQKLQCLQIKRILSDSVFKEFMEKINMKFVKEIRLNQVKQQQMKLIVKAFLPNLISLQIYDLYQNAAIRTSELAKTLPNLQLLSLKRFFKKGKVSIKYLKRGRLQNLRTFLMRRSFSQVNKINDIKMRKLQHINLQDNETGHGGAQAIANADWKFLNKLQLGNNKIGPQGAKMIASADWKQLNQIDLGNNKIRTQGVIAIASSQWKGLTQLDLKSNFIGDLGAKAIAKADWKKLAKINLWDNEIGNKGARAIAQADWKQLTYVFLGNNQIEDQGQGAKAIANADWPSIIKVNLSK